MDFERDRVLPEGVGPARGSGRAVPDGGRTRRGPTRMERCDLRLAGVDRAAWRRQINPPSRVAIEWGQGRLPPELASCEEVGRRVKETMKAAERNNWLHAVGLDYLTLGRLSLYVAVLTGGAGP